MSGNSRQESPEPMHSGPSGHASALDAEESLLALVERTLEYLGHDSANDPGGGTTYSRAFPVGEAIGRQFWERCAHGSGPYGLAMLIEHMVGLPPVTSRTRMQRALFSGFCWQLEQMLRHTAGPGALTHGPGSGEHPGTAEPMCQPREPSA